MAAVLLKGHGGFEQLEYRRDVAVPRPAPQEVLVRIGAAALNNTDINTRTGWYSACGRGAADAGWRGGAVQFPRIQGADACGRIVAVGTGVDPARLGERVLIDPVLRGARQGGYFGSDCDGAFAEFAAVPAINACRVESALTDAELASFPCAYGVAEHMLTRAGVAAGETVLVTGASGGVGSAAVQLARRRGARVIAQTASDKAGVVASLGAERLIGRDADLARELGPESVDVVVDVVGGDAFVARLGVLRRRGRCVVAGAVAGAQVRLDLRTLYLRDLQLTGCTLFEPPVFRALIGYIERGEIRPLVCATYALADIVSAQQRFLAAGHLGKIVLVPAPAAESAG
ncbi:MAG: zinc-binding dehydrogenase [Gammaproteobacteria bacterium]|nr:zinc-binding dehydrogenase [Gammaproteobacteria bacterium]MBV9696572.1 zinc-binding dehydrogenase [Gammaproteobacteria bacterium]